ncbi:MAG: 6-phosphofructokinase [Lachnospiraceae bacterium]|nr:6-phosphofructokinase [Lachnospiraceae bacterium]
MADIKTIGVLTSGGDAPGMNAAIRAVVRTGAAAGVRVIGIKRGFTGLLDKEFVDMDPERVSEIMELGGTILYTARCSKFLEAEYQQMAADNLAQSGIDGLVVIGGDGSYRGAKCLADLGVHVVGVPGTIDFDIGSTDYTIGFDTAVNTAVSAIDKITDTSTSHERCSIIEVMGRNVGYIALWCHIANGADGILIPEKDEFDEQALIDSILNNRRKGRKHHIIINAEGVGRSNRLAKRIEAATGIETRATILGYIQRGGTPTAKDRVYASTMGAYAVDLLLRGEEHRVVAYKDGKFMDFDLGEAITMKKSIEEYQFLLRGLEGRESAGRA